MFLTSALLTKKQTNLINFIVFYFFFFFFLHVVYISYFFMWTEFYRAVQRQRMFPDKSEAEKEIKNIKN